MYIERHITDYIQRMRKQFKVLLIMGSRQVGKSTLLREKFISEYGYILLDDYMELDLAQRDPALFFKNHPLPVIVDEIQRAPSLFLQLKYLADRSSDKGKAILTGSQSYKLLSKASDSLAGRMCLIKISSLSMRERLDIDFKEAFLPTADYIDKRSKNIREYSALWTQIVRGSLPELMDDSIEWESFYRSYLKTYIDSDVTDIINVSNQVKFSNFMRCLAAHSGELFNAASIANDVGVTSKTIQEWTSILEASGIIILLHPYEKTLSKRAVKSPKVYFMDTGLLCYLTRWISPETAMNGAMSGAIFETFVISEIVKSYYNSGHDIDDLYFYRDKDKKEIDLIIEKDHVLYPIEIKKSARPSLDMAKSFSVLSNLTDATLGQGCILCQCSRRVMLSDDVIALPIEYI